MSERRCQTCATPLERKPGEKPSHFVARRTCGRACASRLPKKGPHHEPQDRGYETPCWVWLKTRNPGGYGQVRIDGRLTTAHRWVWEQANGPVPEGLELDHLCRVRECVNPTHLEAVTREVNMRRGAGARLTEAQVAQIKASPLGYRRLAAQYGVARATIRAIKTGRTWIDVEAAA